MALTSCLRPALRAATVGILIAAPQIGHAQDLPATLTFAAGPQGSVNYAVVAGVATLVSRHTPMRTTVIPHSGTTTLLPAVNRGEPPVGANDSGSVYQGYVGVGTFRAAHKNLRLLSSGSLNTIAIAVKADSGIHSGADLKGKRVTARFAALPICQMHSDAILANLGLGWDDVREVPVTNIVEAAQALGEDRVDAMLCATPGVGALREVHARTPVRFVSIDPAPEAMERARKHYPYNQRAATLPAGAFGWMPNETSFLAYPWYLYAHKDLPDRAAYTIVEAMWEHYDDLAQIHAIFRGWQPKGKASPDALIPYHPGAIAFYREKAAWTSEMEALQERLAAQ